jgi:hypothetical protein
MNTLQIISALTLTGALVLCVMWRMCADGADWEEEFGADPALVNRAASRLGPTGFDPGEGALSTNEGE